MNGELVQLDFVQKHGLRNTYIKFRDSRLVVVARNRRLMQEALETHKHWIAKHYAEIKNSIRLFDSNSIFLNSKRYAINYVFSSARPRSDMSGSAITVYANSPDAANRHIDRMIRSRSERISGEMACRKAEAIGRRPSSVKIRRYRKWGACRSGGSITINYCISMLPDDLQDYVISHEVAHLIEMNHSESFWKVVSQLCPNYKSLRKQLNHYDSRKRNAISL
ncbi:MAG: M48 family metallopeptidase [Candidatus Marsarchaeota archaeon]|nr:M48 family metallopeptidase [Candidatus Marsarchaeota archaeon]MCL5412780.1 M48 family metallopeptidase [Candidatus Marsarchaeota archaeon]